MNSCETAPVGLCPIRSRTTRSRGTKWASLGFCADHPRSRGCDWPLRSGAACRVRARRRESGGRTPPRSVAARHRAGPGYRSPPSSSSKLAWSSFHLSRKPAGSASSRGASAIATVSSTSRLVRSRIGPGSFTIDIATWSTAPCRAALVFFWLRRWNSGTLTRSSRLGRWPSRKVSRGPGAVHDGGGDRAPRRQRWRAVPAGRIPASAAWLDGYRIGRPQMGPGWLGATFTKAHGSVSAGASVSRAKPVPRWNATPPTSARLWHGPTDRAPPHSEAEGTGGGGWSDNHAVR